MTTPEQSRRRLGLQGWVILGMGVYIALATTYFTHQNSEQQQSVIGCIGSNFSDMSTALNARATLSKKDSKADHLEALATRAESAANNTFYREAFASTSSAGFFEAYSRYRAAMASVAETRGKVDRRRAHIAQLREETPIPAFPVGTCQ